MSPHAQPRIAEAVEFDRFSVKDFAESGFSPQCMFVDQSTSGSFLENRSEKTLVAPKGIRFITLMA